MLWRGLWLSRSPLRSTICSFPPTVAPFAGDCVRSFGVSPVSGTPASLLLLAACFSHLRCRTAGFFGKVDPSSHKARFQVNLRRAHSDEKIYTITRTSSSLIRDGFCPGTQGLCKKQTTFLLDGRTKYMRALSHNRSRHSTLTAMQTTHYDRQVATTRHAMSQKPQQRPARLRPILKCIGAQLARHRFPGDIY